MRVTYKKIRGKSYINMATEPKIERTAFVDRWSAREFFWTFFSLKRTKYNIRIDL